MNAKPRAWLLGRSLAALSATAIAMTAFGTAVADDDHDRHMTLQSATFTNGGTLPLSMINTLPPGAANGQNTCTADGSVGGNASPQLTWKHAPHETVTFAVIAYDVTAQFTHWQIYNIPAGTTSLPANAGTPASVYPQSFNDFFVQADYAGPCPPKNLMPFSHEYQFTVYALDKVLKVPNFVDFLPPGPEWLYQELIKDTREGHVLASARIVGFYSAVAP